MAKVNGKTKIIEAFLGLLSEHGYADITLGMIAGRAGLSLADLRSEVDSKLDILAAFAREVDRKVLDGVDRQMADEPARERLFDTLMRRFDVLTPHKTALRSLDRAIREDPALALALLPVAIRSQAWMLTAAEIDTNGVRGAIAARGLVMAFGRAARVWLHDDDPGMARTMAELDRRLRGGERVMRRLDDVARLTAPLRALAGRLFAAAPRRRRDHPETSAESPYAADNVDDIVPPRTTH